MFVTEIRDSNDLLAAIGDAMVYCLLCLLFVSLYAYMFICSCFALQLQVLNILSCG